MCRARPGPRCSNTATKRYTGATQNYQRAKHTVDRAIEAGRNPTQRAKSRLSLATLRLNAAQQVFWATPKGREELEHIAESIEEVKRSEFPLGMVNGGVPPEGDPDTPRHARYRELTARLQRANKRREEGVQRRADSYEDLRLVGDERRTLRAQATARGGNIASNAHPLSETNAARLRANLDAAGVTVREWNEEDVARAATWEDKGATSRNYFDNNRARPAQVGRDSEGRRLEIGAKIDGVSPKSKFTRLNTPDGQVVEGRVDFHVTQNSDGKYVVSARNQVKASWEDAAPIDDTKQQVGHLFKSDSKAGGASSKIVVGTADTLDEAKAMRSAAISNFNAPATSALMARDVITSRARRRSTALQTRGFAVWQRYADPQYGEVQGAV